MVAPRPLIHQSRVYDPAVLASLATTEDAGTEGHKHTPARLQFKGKSSPGQGDSGSKGTSQQRSQERQSRELSLIHI